MQLQLNQRQYRLDHGKLRAQRHTLEDICMGLAREFDTHSLQQQEVVNLADRTDSKFLLPVRVLPRFLEALNTDYTILEEAGHRMFTYENTYFDTPSWDLYLQHHNGKLNREKFRLRRYLETEISYFERKFKTNKNRTVKARVPCHMSDYAVGDIADASLRPCLYVNYRRLTLWNHTVNERLTLDYDLHYCRPTESSGVNLDKLLIAELKSFGKARASPFVKRAKEHGFAPQSFSKYCMVNIFNR